MPDDFTEVQDWYVVFMPRIKPRTRLIHWFIDDGLAHCALVRSTLDGKVMIIDPSDWGIAVKFIDQDFESFMLEIGPKVSAILMFAQNYGRIEGYKPRGVYTCVSAIKAILGLSKCSLVQTPFAFYKLLLRYQNTIVVKPWIPYIGGRQWAEN